MTTKCFFKANSYEDSLSVHLWNDDRGAIGIYRLEDKLSDLLTGKASFDPMTAAAVNHDGDCVESVMAAMQEDLARDSFPDFADRAAEKEGRGLCEKFGYEYDAADGNLRRLFQLKEAVASIPMTTKHVVKQTNEVAARHVQSLTDDHAPQPPVDPERGEKAAAFFEGIRSLLADSNLAYPGHDDDGPGPSHDAIREWLEGAVKDELEDHETPLTPDERAAISELTEEVIEFDREQRVLIENFDRQAEAESFKP